MIRRILALLAALLWAAPAFGQSLTLPPSTVYGRLGITAGPAQAIPFATLQPLIFAPPVLISPPAGTTTQGIVGTQQSPTSGSTAGPFSFNLFNITDSFAVTGTGSDTTGLSNGGAVGFRVNTFFDGANVHATGTLISGLYSSTVTSTAALGDVSGLAGTGYCNVACSISGFLEGLNGVAQVGASGSGVNVLAGVDAGALIKAGGSANYRFGINVASLGDVQGTTNDAAIALMGTGGGAIAWKNGILLSNASGGAPISTTGSLVKSDTANTIANILDLGNITVSGNIAAFPFLGISGAGKAIFGAPIGTLAPTCNFEVTATSSGNACISVSTNTTTGFSALSAVNSTAATEIDVIANEAARTAVHYGQTVGNWGEISATSPNGMLLGTVGAVPVVFGTTNTERMRLLLGLSVGTTTDPGSGNIIATGTIGSNGKLFSGGVGVGTGQMQLGGNTSGSVIQTVQAAAGAATVTWGTSTGTPAVTASAPLGITAATGNITCATCATTTATLAKVKVQKFTANGTYTPSTGIINAIIECIGGGGGGGSASGTAGQYYGGGGGGSGGYSRAYVTAATIGASQAVTVGGGGNGGASGSNNGATGSNTSVGTLCVSNGGVGGLFGSAAQGGAGGAGGAAGTGDVAGAGNVGGAGLYSAISTVSFPSGNGASSAFGGGAAGLSTSSGACAAGNNAGAYGGGGSGGICNNVGATSAAGGNASGGIVVVTEFTNQ